MKGALPLIILYVIFMQRLYAELVIQSPEDASAIALSLCETRKLKNMTALEEIKRSSRDFRSMLPDVSVSWSGGTSIEKDGPDSRTKEISIAVTQVVYDGGKRILEYKMGKEKSIREWNMLAEENEEYLGSVRSAYITLSLMLEISAIQRNVLDAAITQEEIAKHEWELGRIIETDYLEVSSERFSRESEWLLSEYQAQRQRRVLLSLMGVDWRASVTVIPIKTPVPEQFNILEPYYLRIVSRINKESLEIESMERDIAYRELLMKWDERKALPSISVQGEIGFSGEDYPLGNPVYTLRCNIALQNRLFPVSASTGVIRDAERVKRVSGSSRIEILPSITFMNEKRISRLSLESDKAHLRELSSKLDSDAFDTLYEHDALVRDYQIRAQQMNILQRKNAADKTKLSNGVIRRIDYLLAENDWAQAKTKYVDTAFKIIEIEDQISRRMGLSLMEVCNNDAH